MHRIAQSADLQEKSRCDHVPLASATNKPIRLWLMVGNERIPIGPKLNDGDCSNPSEIMLGQAELACKLLRQIASGEATERKE